MSPAQRGSSVLRAAHVATLALAVAVHCRPLLQIASFRATGDPLECPWLSRAGVAQLQAYLQAGGRV